jgi:hypothetical protein
MKRIVAGLLALVAGCSSAPISYSATTPKPLDASYACALSKLNELGYTLANTNKDAGFIQANRQTSTGVSEFLNSRKSFDQLTVAIFDAAPGSKTMRVTAATAQQKAGTMFGKSSETGTAPSTTAKTHANAVLATCAGGTVTQTSSLGTFEASIGY